jgi:DNA gyrase subunit A
MVHVPGPDFPTAGFICGKAAIREAYETGKGVLQVRSRASTEVDKRTGRTSIIVTEIPFQVNKARLLERIAELVNEKRIEGIYDLRDESDRQGMRMVVELKRDARTRDRPEPALQDDADAGILRDDHAGDRREPPASAEPEADAAALRRHRVEVVTRRTFSTSARPRSAPHPRRLRSRSRISTP